MAVSDSIAAEARESVARIGSAALVVALPACHNGDLLAAAVAGLTPVMARLIPDRKIVIMHPPTAEAAGPADANGDSGLARFVLLPYPLAVGEGFGAPAFDQGLGSLALAGKALGAAACVMCAAEVTSGTPEQIRSLAEPVLNHAYDLAVPLYGRRRLGALINSSVVYPLTRALYGVRVNYPMAADLAMSPRLIDVELRSPAEKNGLAGWMTTRAACAGLQICQVHYDAQPASGGPDSANLSEALRHVLSRLFLEVERTAGVWQKVRGSQPVRTFGQRPPAEAESSSVDVQPMIETFQRGCRDLFEIWSAILSPATQVELRRIAKLPPGEFRLGHDVWTHVVCDFVLGHRQRVISREHLLGALTPIYLAWVASHAIEVQHATSEAVEARLEAVCLSFEKLKPYLLSRWRWPDRFNP